MMSGDVIVLDVRTKEEYYELRHVNAVLLPEYEIRERAEHILKNKDQNWQKERSDISGLSSEKITEPILRV